MKLDIQPDNNQEEETTQNQDMKEDLNDMKEEDYFIIDVLEQVKYRNFGPLLYLLNQNLIQDPETTDIDGNNALHYAVAFNEIAEVKYFVESLNFDINQKGNDG